MADIKTRRQSLLREMKRLGKETSYHEAILRAAAEIEPLHLKALELRKRRDEQEAGVRTARAQLANANERKTAEQTLRGEETMLRGLSSAVARAEGEVDVVRRIWRPVIDQLRRELDLS